MTSSSRPLRRSFFQAEDAAGATAAGATAEGLAAEAAVEVSKCPGDAKHPHSHVLHGAGIFTYIWVIFGVNVGKYSIHGASGINENCLKQNGGF